MLLEVFSQNDKSMHVQTPLSVFIKELQEISPSTEPYEAKEELILATRLMKGGWQEGSTRPQYQTTTCGRRLPFKAGGEVFGFGGWVGGGAGVVTEVLTASAKFLREEVIHGGQFCWGDQ